MNRGRWNRTFAIAQWCGFVVAGSGACRAQHLDVLVQQSNSQLVTGAANFTLNQWKLGQRAFLGEFDDDYQVNDPGFNALVSGSANMPAGAQALPGSTGLGWDFWPMRVDDVASNLLYWNGQETDGVPGLSDDDVRFGWPPTADYRLSLMNIAYTVDGTDTAIAGGTLATTDASGGLHQHRFYFLDDGDNNGTTDPADGIYVIAMRMRMEGLSASLPLYVVFGTLGSSVAALDGAAFPWVTTYADTLVLLGDYNDNGEVDAADYTVWRNGLGLSGFALPGDGDASEAIDAADYLVWKENYGKVSPSRMGSGATTEFFTNVPEPGGAVLLLVGVGCWALGIRRNGQERLGRLGS